MRGVQAPVAYNFFPNAASGQKILEAPHNLIYLPVTIYVISSKGNVSARGEKGDKGDAAGIDPQDS